MTREMADVARRGGKKNRKWKRQLLNCAAYRRAGRRTINKRRKLKRHVGTYPNDLVAETALARL